MSYGLVLSALLAAATCALLRSELIWRRRTKGAPLPPSRPGWPLIGNLIDIAAVTGHECEAYKEWSRELGSDIIGVQAPGAYMVVLNTKELAKELLDEVAATFSDRPRSEMISLMGWDWMLGFLPYGKAWRKQRRLFNQFFPRGKSTLHADRLPHFLRHFLLGLHNHTENVPKHTKELVAGLMFSLAYGIDITEEPHYLELGEEAVAHLVEASVPGRFMVDQLPWLKYIPEWMPGAGFKRQAALWRGAQERLKTLPYRTALDRRDTASLVTKAMSSSAGTGDVIDGYSDTAVQDLAATFFIAGTETTSASLDFFLIALMLYPEVQRKAQQELDAAFPDLEALPTSEDIAQLPYLNALINEVLRWQSVAPIGLPHLSTADYIYRGYFIPKGSIVIANSWAISRNEKMYPEPETFNPERFLRADGSLDESIPDVREWVFGFGRRICPGRHLASSTVSTAIAAILLLFDTFKPDGEEIPFPIQAKFNVARGPNPFRCSFRPRSAAAKAFLEGLGSDDR